MEYIINKTFANKSIVKFLEYYHVSKSLIYKLELNKTVQVNGLFEKFDYILKENDRLDFDLDMIEVNDVEAFKDQIKVIYEDEDILVVYKPPFMLVHSDGNTNDTLANRVSFYYQNHNMNNGVRHVHRIDVETSGMVIFAKHFLSHSYLANLFENHQIKKTYVCLCKGKFLDNEGVIDSNIGKDRHSNKQIVNKNGKTALTKYTVISTKANISKVLVQIEGGRKHQIRVHLSSIKHPIVGDKLYGDGKGVRCMLHFKEVEFVHPRTLKPFTCRCGEDF
jgi:23S rRNA pseudouridine1911/1915/1917 synthase